MICKDPIVAPLSLEVCALSSLLAIGGVVAAAMLSVAAEHYPNFLLVVLEY